MPRGERIKDYRFPVITGGSPSVYSQFTDHPLNGELLSIDYGAPVTGSAELRVSGTSELLWSAASLSGAAVQTAYPIVYAVNSINGAGSPQAFVNRVFNAPLLLTGSFFIAGSITTFNVKYR